MCKWAADSVIEDYGINPKKVHLIVGGPNINEDLLKKGTKLTCPKEPTKTNPLTISFIGKDWGSGVTHTVTGFKISSNTAHGFVGSGASTFTVKTSRAIGATATKIGAYAPMLLLQATPMWEEHDDFNFVQKRKQQQLLLQQLFHN